MQTGYALLELLAAHPVALLFFFVFALILIFVMLLWAATWCANYLRRSEQRRHLLFDRAAVGMGKVDSQERIVRVNNRACKMLGYTRHELLGISLRDLTAPEDRAYRDELHAQLRDGAIDHFENEERFVKRDGTLLWVHVTVWALRDETAFWGAVAAIHDISTRKRTEEQLRASEEKFRAVFEQAAVGIARVQFSDARWVDANDALCRMLGYTREELCATAWPDITHPEDVNLDLVPFHRMASGNLDRYRVEKRFLHKQGHIVWARLAVSLVRDAAGVPAYEIAVIENITERKKAEELLRQSEERFRVVAENIPQMIWVADAHTNFVYLSPKWVEYTGTTEQQNANGGWTAVLHAEDRAEALEQWNRAVESRGPYEVEYRIRRHDGEYRWHLARAVPILNSNTNENLWFGTLTDIEDQKRAHRALVRSEKLASVGRLAATVAHEINNPLEAIMNSVYLVLQDQGLSVDSLQRLKTAEEELVRVAHMTRQTLGFYRENSAPAPVQATSLVKAVVEMYTPKLMQRSITLSMESNDNLTIHAVAGEIRQVVSNIMANAIDASRPGGRLRIRTGSVPLNGSRSVRITLADTGEGIRPEHLERIFEPFFTTKEAIGTGLGLWVSSEIVKRHNGSLRVRSQRGKGTVFSIWLPQREHPVSKKAG